eukprot:12676206-Alexandrium_andersonii.AAC.1
MQGGTRPEPTHVPNATLHLRLAQKLDHAGLLPRRRRGWMLMEDASTAPQLSPVELGHELQM